VMSWEDEDDDWETADLKVPDAKDEEAWSDEEGHDAHKAAAAEPMKPMSAPAPPKPKSSLQLKIEAREQRDKEEAEAKAAMRAQLMGDGGADMPEDVSDEAAKRMRQTRLEEAANIDNAMDAFGLGLATAKADKEEKQRHDQRQTKAEAEVAAAGGFEVYEPKSDAEFEKLAEMISTKLGKYDGKKGQAICLKAMLRSLSTTMSSDECKDLASFVSVLSNDKIKAEREKDKKKTKAKGKGKLNIAASKASDYDDMNGNDYDFM